MSFNLIQRVRLPAEDTPAPYPAVVLVHGWLGNENSMWAFQSILPRSALAISMRAPLEAEGGYGWFQAAEGTPEVQSAAFDQGLAALREFVSRLPREYPVDPERIILMGFSQGAAMSYSLLLSDPNLIAALAALAGFLPDPARQWVAPGRLTAKRVFIAHGLEDATVRVQEAAQAREAMARCGAEVTYAEYPIGHKLSTQGMKDLKAWLAGFVS